MNEIDHFKVFIFHSDDVVADVDHLYVKRIYLVDSMSFYCQFFCSSLLVYCSFNVKCAASYLLVSRLLFPFL
jgi:hypothetical protein